MQFLVSNIFASMIQYESFGDNMVVGQRDAKISEDGKDSLFGHEDRQPRQGTNGLDVRCKTRLHQKIRENLQIQQNYETTASVSQSGLQVLSVNGNIGEFAVCGCSIVRRSRRTSEPTHNQHGVPETSSSEEKQEGRGKDFCTSDTHPNSRRVATSLQLNQMSISNNEDMNIVLFPNSFDIGTRSKVMVCVLDVLSRVLKT